MSPHSAKSEWVKDEVAWAMRNRDGFVVPVLIEQCEPENFHIRLPIIQYIDYRENTKVAHQQLIQKLVRAEYKTDSLSNIINALMSCPSKEILTVVKIETGDKQQASVVGENQKADAF